MESGAQLAVHAVATILRFVPIRDMRDRISPLDRIAAAHQRLVDRWLSEWQATPSHSEGPRPFDFQMHRVVFVFSRLTALNDELLSDTDLVDLALAIDSSMLRAVRDRRTAGLDAPWPIDDCTVDSPRDALLALADSVADAEISDGDVMAAWGAVPPFVRRHIILASAPGSRWLIPSRDTILDACRRALDAPAFASRPEDGRLATCRQLREAFDRIAPNRKIVVLPDGGDFYLFARDIGSAYGIEFTISAIRRAGQRPARTPF